MSPLEAGWNTGEKLAILREESGHCEGIDVRTLST